MVFRYISIADLVNELIGFWITKGNRLLCVLSLRSDNMKNCQIQNTKGDFVWKIALTAVWNLPASRENFWSNSWLMSCRKVKECAANRTVTLFENSITLAGHFNKLRCKRPRILDQEYKPTFAKWTRPSLSIGRVQFPFQGGCRTFSFLFYIEWIFLLTISEDPDQTPRSAASDLGLHCLLMSHNWDG